MQITEIFIENDRIGCQEVCSDCQAYGLKKRGLTRSDPILNVKYGVSMSNEFDEII